MRRISLSLKLGLGTLLLVVIVFAVSLGTLFLQSRRVVRQEAQERAMNVLNTTMQRFHRHMHTVETATDINYWLIMRYLRPDSLLTISNRVVRLNPHVDGCSISMEPDVFPQYGRYYSVYTVREPDSITTVVEKQYEYFEKVWYKTPRVHGKACWVAYFDEADSLELTIDGMVASYSRPLFDAERRFKGVVSTDLSLRRLSEIINDERPYPNSYYVMTGEDGYYILHPDTAKLFTTSIFDGVDPTVNADRIALGHEMTSGSEGSMHVMIDGRLSLVCYKPVAGTPWSLAVVCPDSDILQGYYRLGYILLPLVVIGLLAILFICRQSVTHAIRPLSKLDEQSRLIADGHYDAQLIRHTRRSDVIGALQNSFATMQESLARHVSDIHQAGEETKQRNEEQARATQLAEEADRQKTAFLQNMTHQIRTPLNIVMGFAQVLRDSHETGMPEEETRSITNMMKHNNALLVRMLLMLYDSSDRGLTDELRNLRLDSVACNDVSRESLDFASRFFPEVHFDFHSSLPDNVCITTSGLYLKRSLRELLSNAAKYSDGKHILLSNEQTYTTVRFVVQDTGMGMPENYRERMFKPFTKVNELSEGLGLGLSLCHRHVENLGGTLTLDTDYREGCRFVIELPLK